MLNINQLKYDLNETQIKYNVSTQTINQITNNIYNKTKQKDEYTIKITKFEKAHELLSRLKQFKMDSKKDFILTTINTALLDIFGEDITIDIEASSTTDSGKLNMKYDIVLYQNKIEIARNEDLTDSNGGGVLSIISILFKILVGYIYSNNTFYMFDESLSQVSEDYRPRLSKFLRNFCDKYGFTIILVSHNEDLDIHADLIYKLDATFDKKEIPILHIDEILGEYPKENYIYTKIKNFQSIIDLEFRFKGFTVIRGRNNIGKSATLRAINAVIFNDFSKKYQRISDTRGLETSIEFGNSDNDSHNIKLIYKSQKTTYQFDGMEFIGKNLAFDKVQEKIESIGFKYINLKETYKNFKGNLKDQTERLSLTTQHDNLFLIGSKNTDSGKVFDFLFDSYLVAQAISRIKTDINDLMSNINNLEIELKKLNTQLTKEKKLQSIYLLKYHSINIKLFSGLTQSILSKKYHLDNKKKLISLISNYILLDKYKTSLTHMNINYDKILFLFNNKQDLKNKIEHLIKLISMKYLFNNYQDNNYRFNLLTTKYNNIKNIPNLYNNYLFKIKDILNRKNIIISHSNNMYNLEQKEAMIISTMDDKKIEILNIVSFTDKIKNYIERLKSIYTFKDLLVKNLYQYQIIINNNQNLYNTYHLKKQESLNLNQEFGLEKCKCCNGIGYTCI